MTIDQAAHHGALIADALAMPVHWYYDRDAMDRDYPDLTTCHDPLPQHPDSILWRSQYTPLNEKGDILHDQAEFWGKRFVHYHQNLRAGENTVNFQLAVALYDQVQAHGNYDPTRWAKRYVDLMLTPGWHRDTYVEEYHRAFFTRYARGKPILKCGISDEHIGGLATVPALLAALPDFPVHDHRQTVKDHVALTHRHSNVLRAADCLTRLLRHIADGTPLRNALMTAAGDWFSTRKAETWSHQPDRHVIGRRFSPACYIDQSFPASLYLAWKYHDDFPAAVIANAKVGGDSCHRGAVVGSLVAAEVMRQTGDFHASPL
ncbi:MAG: ADP-ribosylglycohydrolase family protein [Verrucomicrobiae bacterium]|nr:ADP-ribosylglycohydrolase family protein [Verrucomicrobiae bacterium]NNJ86470.1 ADP-ribosylglycohydrolase family protein [Akkermansiaceae bacterium]